MPSEFFHDLSCHRPPARAPAQSAPLPGHPQWQAPECFSCSNCRNRDARPGLNQLPGRPGYRLASDLHKIRNQEFNQLNSVSVSSVKVVPAEVMYADPRVSGATATIKKGSCNCLYRLFCHFCLILYNEVDWPGNLLRFVNWWTRKGLEMQRCILSEFPQCILCLSTN